MISIILPTIRQELYNDTIKSIINAAAGWPFEIIVVADFQGGPGNFPLKWIYEPERKGVIDAINKGYAAAQGEHIFTLNDESRLYPKALLNMAAFCNRMDNKVLTSPIHLPPYPFYYYKKWFAPFPFAHRSLIEKCAEVWDCKGNFFDPAYKCFYADPDLSLRAYDAGFKVMECPDAVIAHSNDINRQDHKNNVASYVLDDRKFFKMRWQNLGEFVDP